MAGDLPIIKTYQPGSTPPTLSFAADPAIGSLEQALDREMAVWARIRGQASQRYQEFQDEKKREQERAEKELLILYQQQEAQEKAQAESDATCTPILSWEREIEEWARIRAQATERYQKYQLERESEQDLAEHDKHLPIPRQRQVVQRKSKLRMIHNWLNRLPFIRATSASGRPRQRSHRMLDCFRRRYHLEVSGSDGIDESGKAERGTIQGRYGLLEASVCVRKDRNS